MNQQAMSSVELERISPVVRFRLSVATSTSDGATISLLDGAYLSGATITANTKANPTVVTIGAYVPTGTVVTITGSNSSPSINGTYTATNVDSKIAVDLPSLNRDITTLVEMIPGVRQVQGVTAGGSQVIDLSGNFALGAATRRSQSVFYVDGSENMGAWRLQALPAQQTLFWNARRLLLLERSAILEPALEFMAIGADEVKSDHCSRP
jgi:hypothetical protein